MAITPELHHRPTHDSMRLSPVNQAFYETACSAGFTDLGRTWNHRPDSRTLAYGDIRIHLDDLGMLGWFDHGQTAFGAPVPAMFDLAAIQALRNTCTCCHLARPGSVLTHLGLADSLCPDCLPTPRASRTSRISR